MNIEKKSNVICIEMTHEEIMTKAEEMSQRVLSISASEAWRRICEENMYDGTPFAGEMEQLMFLAGYYQVDGLHHKLF